MTVSLRTRLVLLSSGLSGLIVILLGFVAYGVHGHALYDDLDRMLVAALDHAEGLHNLQLPPAAGATAPLTPLLPNVALWVGTADGQVLAATPNAFLAPQVDPQSVLSRPSPPPFDPVVALAPHWLEADPGEGAFGTVAALGGPRWRTYVRPLDGGHAGHYVIAATPLNTIDLAVAEFRLMLLALGVAGALAAPLAATLLVARALQPITALTATARSIARSRKLDQRVPVTSPRDELGQLAVTFNEMLSSIEQAYQAQQRFVADASHELRAPLTAIQANLELVQRRPEMPAADRQEATTEALRESQRLGSLVEQLLTLARADAGIPLRRQRTDLDRLLLETLAEVRHLQRGQHLEVAHIEPVIVQGDPGRLKQLFIILLDNAFKYTPESGTVTVAVRRTGALAEVTVSDTGVGIPARDLTNVFERFYRADPGRGRDPGGTGLGLSIARRIVLDHGGDITLRSETGRGTTATVTLPVAA